jgi:branched-chain amino acid aminotransferase
MSDFEFIANPRPVAADVRAALLADPGFGRVFTDHMAMIRYSDVRGWHDPSVVARAPIPMDPATAVLHYAQEIFEGMKAYRHPDGATALFRPQANARRFNRSAARLAMPALPEDLFIGSVEALLRADGDWMPTVEGGSVYLRPFMFASEVFLGVKPSAEYLYLVIASPSGNYWKGGARAISIWVSEHYTRAAPGGTGGAKCGGNYAASLTAQAEATAQGCDQVVFLDAVERRYVEELGGMNIFFVFDDGSLATPPVSGTILEGITRDSLLTLARDEGLLVREEPYAIDRWRADAESGTLREAFACGTAAVVTSIGEVRSAAGNFTIGAGGPGQITERLRDRLTGIQRGTMPDPHNWVHRVD